MLAATPIAFAVGLALLVPLVSLLESARRRAEAVTRAELERLVGAALTDNLTGLGNHRAFHEDLTRATRRHAHLEIASLSLVTVDVDGLRAFNEERGHHEGDARLRAVARCLHETAGDRRAVYRVDGDRFSVILAGANAWDAFRFAQRVQERLGLLDAERPITVTAGIAEAEGPLGEHVLVRHADMALAEARRTLRAALIYSPGISAGPDERHDDAHGHHLQTLATVLARAVDAKDCRTRSHCETVSELCSRIGIELGLDEQRLAKLRLAGLLHDVGKIGIPDAVLQKPARLTGEELEIMKTHSGLGHSIVSGTDLDEQADWILHHHERPDGHGYPGGLIGDAIPLESRVMLVADAFAAITSDRVYRKCRSEQEALVELELHAGTQFDPACVAALRRALDRNRARAPGLARPEPRRAYALSS